jgi:hypothetical protein
MKHWGRTLVLAGACTALLAACGSSDSGTSGGGAAGSAGGGGGGGGGGGSATAFDPCKVLTANDAQQALGRPVDPPKTESGSGPICSYFVTTGATEIDASHVTLKGITQVEFDGVRRASLAGKDFQIVPASGVGDDAYYQVGQPFAFLFVKKGSTFFYVIVDSKQPIEQREAAEKTLALSILGRL